MQQAFKIGLVDNSVELSVIGYEPGWVEVTAPNYFLVWMREADVIEKIELVPSDATQVVDVNDSEIITKIVSAENQSSGSSDQIGETVSRQKTLINWHAVYIDSSESSMPIGLLSKGKVVTIEEQVGDFSRASWNGGVEAWIFAKFLEP